MRGQEAILPQYRFAKNHSLNKILPADCYEDFWHQLGKTNLLTAQILFANQKTISSAAKESLSNIFPKAIELGLTQKSFE